MKKIFWTGIVLSGALLLRYLPPEQAEERLIAPDGVEYAVSAVRLIEGKGYTLSIQGESYPPRYPFGYSLSLVPFYLLFGKALGNGIFCTLLFSLATLLLFFLLVQKVFGREVALWALLFLILSPLHIYWSRLIMADIPSCFVVLLAIWVLFAGEITPQRVFWVGGLIGVGGWFKYLSLLFFPICILFFFFREGKMREKFYCAFSLFSGTILFLIPLLLYNQWIFGSPFRTGFSFWTPEWVRWENVFSVSYALRTPPLPSRASLPNLLVFGQFMLGISYPWYWNPYPFFVVPFIGIGMWRILRDAEHHNKKRKEFLWFALLALAIFYGFFSFYFAQNVRYFMPVIPLLLALAAVGFDHFFRRCPIPFQKGIVFLSGLILVISPAVLWKIEGTFHERKDYVYLIRNKTEGDACIVTAWDAVSFYHELQRDSKRIYLPISEDIEYVHRPFHPSLKRILPFTIASEKLEEVERIVESKKPIYVDSMSCRTYAVSCEKLKRHFLFREVANREEIQLYRLEGDGDS